MKITPLESQLRPSAELNVRRASSRDFGLDTSKAEQNLSELEAHIQKREEEDAAIRTAKTLAQTRTDMDQYLIDAQSKAEAGAPDFTKNFADQYKTYTEKVLENENSPYARKLLELKFAEVGAGYTEQAARYQASSQVEKKVMDFGQIGDQYSNLVAVNPGQYGTLRKEFDGALASSGLNGNAQEKLRIETYGRMATSTFKARILTDPDGVIRDLKAGKGAAADLPAGAAATLLHMADNQIKHEIAKGKQAVFEDTKQSVTLMRQGYPVPEQNRQAILELFGDDAAKRDDLLAEFDSAKAFGDTVRATAMASPEEVSTAYTAYDTTAADQNADLTVREIASQDKARFATVIKQRNEQIKQDPVDYVLANSEATNASFKAFMEVQKTTDNEDAVAAAQAQYVTDLKADQRRLGIPESNITLFSSAMVEQVKDRVNSVDRSPEGAKNLMGMLSGLHDTWGQDWPIVYRQLREKKALDGTLDAMAYMTDPRKRADAATLASAWVNREALNKQLSDDTKKDINEEVESVALPLGTAMSNEGRNEQFVSFKEAAKLLAMQLTADGMTPSAAASTAFNKVVGSDYHVVGKMRIPVTDADNIAIDPDTVLEGSIIAKREALSDTGKLKSIAGQSDKSIEYEMPSHIEDAYWVTANGNQGIQLKWSDKAIVEKEDGSPVIYTWNQLKDMTIKAKAERKKKLQDQELEEMFGGPPKRVVPKFDELGPE